MMGAVVGGRGRDRRTVMKTHGLLVCGAALAALVSGAAAGPLGAPALQGLSADIGLIEPVRILIKIV